MLSDVFISFQDMPDAGAAIALAYSGCLRGASGNPCEGCHNPALWNFGSKKEGELARRRLKNLLTELEESGGAEMIEGVILLGGEPFDQNMDEILKDIETIDEKIPGVKIAVYTGYNSLAEATSGCTDPMTHPLVAVADYIKTGEFNHHTPPAKGSELASGNQKMYKIKRKKGDAPCLQEIEF